MLANDLTIYSEFANEWWLPGSARFRSLQNITPFRLELIEQYCGPFSERDVVDLGCGGGLLAIPLLERGARVVGVDRSTPSVAAAAERAAGRGSFVVSDIRSVPLPDCCADVVLLADVLDHIPDYPTALCEAARLTRPAGLVFVGTINRNLFSRFVTVFLGEGLRLIPRGTHDHRLFIRPAELSAAAISCGLNPIRLQGEWPCLLPTLRRRAVTLRRSRSALVAYSMVFKKGLN